MHDPLLTVRRVVIEPAPRNVLQQRLDGCNADKAARLSRRPAGAKWPASVSDGWLQADIDTLTHALGVDSSADGWREAGLVCQACAGDAPRGKCLNPKCIGGPIVRELVPAAGVPGTLSDQPKGGA